MAEEQDDRDRRDGDRDGDGGGGSSRIGAMEAMRSANAHLRELTGREAESVVHIEPDDDGGWLVGLEVLELRRIPNTTDLLACYELQVDEDGELIGYRRLRRYTRAEQGGEAPA
jgi:hypothetical protein